MGGHVQELGGGPEVEGVVLDQDVLDAAGDPELHVELRRLPDGLCLLLLLLVVGVVNVVGRDGLRVVGLAELAQGILQVKIQPEVKDQKPTCLFSG